MHVIEECKHTPKKMHVIEDLVMIHVTIKEIVSMCSNCDNIDIYALGM